jgi:GYF domain 2
MQWYYAIDGERFGPVPHSELERLVQDGTIVADTLIWRQGMNEWQSLAQVRSVNPAWIAERRSPTPPALETAATELAAPKPAVIHDEKLDKLTPAGFWPRVARSFFLGHHVRRATEPHHRPALSGIDQNQ